MYARHPRLLLAVALVLAGCRGSGDDADKGKPTDGTQPTGSTLTTPPQPTSGQPAPDILVDPLMLDFGTATSSGSEPQSVLLVNTGDAPLTVSALAADRPDFRINTTTPLVVAPETTAWVELVFVPTQEGPRSGSLSIISDDPDEGTVTVALAGVGNLSGLASSPSSVTFADASVGCPESETLTLSNEGDEDLVLASAVISGEGFAILGAPPLPYTFAPGEQVEVTIEWTTEQVNVATPGSLELTTEAGDTLTVALEGTATTEVQVFTETVELSPPAVDVLVALDTSCSMEDDNVDDVSQGFPQLVSALDDHTDWQLALVNDDTGCSPGLLDPTVPYASQLLVAAAFDVTNPFGGIYLVEALLSLSDLALGQTGPKECNEGLLREGAQLHILMISDENEQSNGSVTNLVSNLQAVVPTPDDLVISSIVDINRNCGDGSGGARYVEAAQLTGGFVLNVCGNWGASLGTEIEALLQSARPRSFALPPGADAASLQVDVNGAPAVDVAVDGDKVTVFEPLLTDDDVVEITYVGTGVCP